MPATARGRRGRVDRAIDYGSFYARAALALRRLPRADVIVALTTPPFIATLGALERRLRGTRLVVWTMDVYPEVAIALGALPRGGL
ncbi:MAG TPA: glycosyltransferase WbuB, partial [Candidatus Hydrogenedentes bacterium]|nr:glycosyltransferase WbuB [Candidatus Hydrogenedentota bacterium]